MNVIPLCTDLHVLQYFFLDCLFLLRAIARHGQQIVDVAEDLPLTHTQDSIIYRVRVRVTFYVLQHSKQRNNSHTAQLPVTAAMDQNCTSCLALLAYITH